MIKQPPSQANIESFLANILSKLVTHNNNAPWLNIEEKIQAQRPIDIWQNNTYESFQKQKSHNWKTPGIDKVQNFWIKKQHTTHHLFLNEYNKLCKDPKLMPSWLTFGTTNLVYKKETSQIPKITNQLLASLQHINS